MLSSYKTQCPRCHTIYPLPQSKVGDEKARANCGKCGHTFFLNLNLIEPDEPPAPRPAPATAARTQVVPTTTNPKQPLTAQSEEQKTLISDNSPMADDHLDVAVGFSDDELNDFLKHDVAINDSAVAASAKDNAQHTGEDEAWLDDLLKNEDSPNIQVANSSTGDELSKIIGDDIDRLIPDVQVPEDPKVLMKKIQARLSHEPTQEQLATKRGVVGQLGWLLGSVAMLALLAGQYVFFNQESIAKNPEKAAQVKALCSFCALPSADASAISTSYELREGRADFSTDLIGTLKNRSGTDQLYPNIKISIHGASGLLGELALGPKEYLAYEESVLSSAKDGQFLLTLDIPQEEISTVTIEPFY